MAQRRQVQTGAVAQHLGLVVVHGNPAGLLDKGQQLLAIEHGQALAGIEHKRNARGLELRGVLLHGITAIG